MWRLVLLYFQLAGFTYVMLRIYGHQITYDTKELSALFSVLWPLLIIVLMVRYSWKKFLQFFRFLGQFSESIIDIIRIGITGELYCICFDALEKNPFFHIFSYDEVISKFIGLSENPNYYTKEDKLEENVISFNNKYDAKLFCDSFDPSRMGRHYENFKPYVVQVIWKDPIKVKKV